jgi:peptide chain release factor 3
MLLDNRKGVETQTRKLFEVCKLRRTPIFTFVNKCDRPGESPLKLIDDVEADLGIRCFPVTWPITAGGGFVGVLDRLHNEVLLFDRGTDHGQRRATVLAGGLDEPRIQALIGESALAELREQIELLDMAGSAFDEDAIRSGALSPTFFGSALTNFGVEPFLRTFLEYAPAPTPREADTGTVNPHDEAFTGLVFKIQANMDPKHRDRIAFVRICSGRFESGISVKNTRSGKDVRLASPQQFLARERVAIDEAYAGDVIGVHDRGSLRIGDTLSADGDLHFAGIPRFSPEHFARVTVPDPLRRKHLDTGLRHLSEEGAAQVFYTETVTGPAPIVGAVGMLQFDVLLHRLEHEYSVTARLERMPYSVARWVTGPADALARAAAGYERALVYDSRNQPLLLFGSEWVLNATMEKEKDLTFHSVAP